MLAEGLELERRLLLAARTRGHSPALERAVAGFSKLGEHSAVWLAIGAVGALAQPARRSSWRRALRTILGVYAANTTIKLIVRRRRPQMEGLPPLTGTTTGLSFPSAHAATSFAAALAYSRRGLPAGPLYTMAGAMAASRVYLGVHHPSDVLAGAALGTAMAAALSDPREAAARP